MSLPSDVERIVSRYKSSIHETARIFGIPGYSTFGAKTLSGVLDTEYNSTASTLRKLHTLQPGRFDLDYALEELTKYKTQALTGFVKDTPNPRPTTDTRKTNHQALDLIRGKSRF